MSGWYSAKRCSAAVLSSSFEKGSVPKQETLVSEEPTSCWYKSAASDACGSNSSRSFFGHPPVAKLLGIPLSVKNAIQRGLNEFCQHVQYTQCSCKSAKL